MVLFILCLVILKTYLCDNQPLTFFPLADRDMVNFTGKSEI